MTAGGQALLRLGAPARKLGATKDELSAVLRRRRQRRIAYSKRASDAFAAAEA